MTDDELLPTEDPTPEVPATQAPEAEGAPYDGPDAGPDSGPLADAPPVADAAPEKPREVIRGIHPELLCQCPECDPDFVELQWFSPEEQKKVKGDVMLFCARSSRKYFTPVIELTAWITEKGGPRKARRGGGD